MPKRRDLTVDSTSVSSGVLHERMHPRLTEAHRREFWENGVTVVRQLIPHEWIPHLEQAAEENRRVAAGEIDEGLFVDTEHHSEGFLFGNETWRYNSRLREFIFKSDIADVAAFILDSREIRLYEDIFIYKAAGTAVPTDFHQDEPQLGTTGRQVCNIWFSLEPVTEVSGALRIVPGSHNGPQYTPRMPEGREDDAEEFAGGPLPDPELEPERFPIRSFDLDLGDAIIFHPLALHGSRSGVLERPRRTFSLRFVGDDIRWIQRRSAYHTWVRDMPLSTGARLEHELFPLLRS